MDVSFCDLCGSPIHKVGYTLITLEESELSELQEELKSVFFKPLGMNKKFKIDRKKICEDCYAMLQLIFEEKYEGISKIAEKLDELYKMSL